ncbi:MAG: hypothetical protein KF883_04790 [Thermomicrobiales bacterium]|nr:hypothetical protein [Thermomicrobiales bacterium]
MEDEIVVSVRREGHPTETDFALDPSLNVNVVARLLSTALDWQVDWDQFAVEVEAAPPIRLLRGDESFAEAGVFSGARVVLRLRSRDRSSRTPTWSSTPAEKSDEPGGDDYTWREIEGI